MVISILRINKGIFEILGMGFDTKRDLGLLRQQVKINSNKKKNANCPILFQIEEIRSLALATEKSALGVLYGIDEKNLSCPLDDLGLFDLTR